MIYKQPYFSLREPRDNCLNTLRNLMGKVMLWNDMKDVCRYFSGLVVRPHIHFQKKCFCNICLVMNANMVPFIVNYIYQ